MPSLRLTASRPPIQRRAASLFFLASSFSSAEISSSLSGFYPVAVVRFVVQHDDTLKAQEVVGDPVQHLAVVLDRVRRSVAALEE